MHITFYRRPCLYPDATELFYAYVNGTPAKNLAFPGPCALPKSVMESMMQEALCRSGPRRRTGAFLFRALSLPKYGSSSYTCVARLLAFTYPTGAALTLSTAFFQHAKPPGRWKECSGNESCLAGLPHTVCASGSWTQRSRFLCQWDWAVPGARRTEGPLLGSSQTTRPISAPCPACCSPS